MQSVNLDIHERISQRHPEISEDDVRSAFFNIIRCRQRSTGEFVGIGADSNSRMLELVYSENFVERTAFVYHALTPPTKKTISELGFGN